MRTERTTDESRSVLEMQFRDGRRPVDIIATLGGKTGTGGSGGALAGSAGEFARTAKGRGPDDWTKHAHGDGKSSGFFEKPKFVRRLF
jgi:hypothetical protein